MITDTPMVEQIARAIFEADTAIISTDYGRPTWEDLKSEPYRRDLHYIDLARAVLECLRTPTPEMVEAGYDVDVVWREGSDGPVQVFVAMIDRALLPSKGEGE